MTDKEYVKVYCCADCAYYDMKKHRCRNGAKDEGTGREHFYRDCRLGIHNENESVPIEVLQEIRQEIESNMETITGTYDASTPEYNMPSHKIERNFGRKECIAIIDKHIKEIKGSDKE